MRRDWSTSPISRLTLLCNRIRARASTRISIYNLKEDEPSFERVSYCGLQKQKNRRHCHTWMAHDRHRDARHTCVASPAPMRQSSRSTRQRTKPYFRRQEGANNRCWGEDCDVPPLNKDG
jgi:hypothetical protein